MEYANGGDLQKVISDCKKANKNMSEEKIWKAASEILIGLYILHEKGILHRDLKSANVFISNDVCKLGDLNVSKISYEKDLMARTQTGTPYYASP
jgi:NIMA (never in mitosis gene a)-related kinase